MGNISSGVLTEMGPDKGQLFSLGTLSDNGTYVDSFWGLWVISTFVRVMIK